MNFVEEQQEHASKMVRDLILTDTYSPEIIKEIISNTIIATAERIKLEGFEVDGLQSWQKLVKKMWFISDNLISQAKEGS